MSFIEKVVEFDSSLKQYPIEAFIAFEKAKYRYIISEKIKRGSRLGRAPGSQTKEGIETLVNHVKEKKKNNIDKYRDLFLKLIEEKMSHRKIVSYLNENKIKAPRGGNWTLCPVQNYIKYIKCDGQHSAEQQSKRKPIANKFNISEIRPIPLSAA